jgi:hypothetical protein
MENILGLVTTPFAFAALLVLAAAGLLEVNNRRRGATALQGKAFWLILVFGLAANIIYILKDIVFTDVNVRGEIRQANGRPIPNATIDFAGVGRAASSDSGQFELSIPYSRQSKKYTVYSFVNGIAGKKLEINGANPGFVNIQYTSDPNLTDYLTTHDTVQISQNIGIPIVNVMFRTNNQISGRVKLSLFQADIETPSGDKVSFFPAMVTRNGMPVPPGDMIIDYENQSAEYSIMTQSDPNRQMQIGQDMMQRFGSGWMSNCLGMGIQADAENALVAYFDNNFFWASGKYELDLKYRIEGNIEVEKYEFTVSEADSNKLKNVRNSLKFCRGVAFDGSALQMLSYADGLANNIIIKNIAVKPAT